MLRFLFSAIFGSLFKLITGWWQARQLQKQTGRAINAEAKVTQENEIIKTQEVRHEIDQKVAAEPEAPPQQVGDAAAGTAASVLRDKWSRD